MIALSIRHFHPCLPLDWWWPKVVHSYVDIWLKMETPKKPDMDTEVKRHNRSEFRAENKPHFSIGRDGNVMTRVWAINRLQLGFISQA